MNDMDYDENDDGNMTLTTTFGVILIWLAILIPLWLIAFGVVFYDYEAYVNQTPVPDGSVITIPVPAPPDGTRG